MKGLKKLLTTVLAGAMAFTLALGSGNAVKAEAEETHTITVTNTIAGQNQYQYKELEYVPTSDPELGAYTLIENGLFNEAINSSNYVVVSDGYVTWKSESSTDADKKAFAKELEAVAAADEDHANAVNSKVAEAKSEGSTDGENVVFNVSDYGYYMVYSSLGS